MSNITEISNKKETGNEYIRKTLERLEEDGVELEDVVILSTETPSGRGVVFTNDMHYRDLAYLNVLFNNWIKDKI